AWVAAVDLLLALLSWSAFSGGMGFELAAFGLTWLQPALALVGVLTYLSALGAIAHRTADRHDVRSGHLLAAGAGMTFVIGGGAWLARALADLASLPTLALASLALSVVAILVVLRIVS